MTTREKNYIAALKQEAFFLQCQLDFHLKRISLVTDTDTKEQRLRVMGDLHQRAIDIRRKLRYLEPTPTPTKPIQPTKGEYDMTMIYNYNGDYYNG
jgi:hypothetical protein